MPSPPAPLDLLVEHVRSALHARRVEALAPAERVRAALTSYVSAVEQRIARTYAQDHQLKTPGSAELDPDTAAQRLLELVQLLPELRASSKSSDAWETRPSDPGPRSVASGPRLAAESPDESDPPAPTKSAIGSSPLAIAGQSLERLSSALEGAPLVIVGGVAHPERLTGLDDRFQNQVEWIDTTRQGTHAIGNLERRIREGRVAALVMLEGSLSHKHYDPLVAAARHVALPCAYAGKGGRTALSRALFDLEDMLAKAASRP